LDDQVGKAHLRGGIWLTPIMALIEQAAKTNPRNRL